MDKKDIYEHLANIYLDASSKKKNKVKASRKFKNLFFASLIMVMALSVALGLSNKNGRRFESSVMLILCPDTLKINFNFDPAKKEIYSLKLNQLDLTRYNKLGFSVKKSNYNDSLSLKVEFTNAFNEKSFIYLRGIPSKWKEYELAFSDFKNISDWSQLKGLAFIVEEWNAKKKKDVVYIDNIRVIR